MIIKILNYNESVNCSNKLIKEDKLSNDETYFSMLKLRYQDENLINNIIQGESYARQMTGKNIITRLSDSENSIIRYIETNDTIYLLGLITKSGIKRSDLIDFDKWIAELLDKLIEGKVLYSTPNEVSMMMLDRLIQKAKIKGITLNKTTGRNYNLGNSKFMRYQDIQVRKV